MSLMDPVATLIDEFDLTPSEGPLVVERRGPPEKNDRGAYEPADPVLFNLTPWTGHNVEGRDLLHLPEADRSSEIVQIYARGISFPGAAVNGGMGMGVGVGMLMGGGMGMGMGMGGGMGMGMGMGGGMGMGPGVGATAVSLGFIAAGGDESADVFLYLGRRFRVIKVRNFSPQGRIWCAFGKLEELQAIA